MYCDDDGHFGFLIDIKKKIHFVKLLNLLPLSVQLHSTFNVLFEQWKRRYENNTHVWLKDHSYTFLKMATIANF